MAAAASSEVIDSSSVDIRVKLFQGLGWSTNKQDNVKKAIYALKKKNNVGFTSKGMGCAIKLVSPELTGFYILTSRGGVSLMASHHRQNSLFATLKVSFLTCNYPF